MADELTGRAASVPPGRFGAIALRRCGLVDPALERRRIANLRLRTTPIFKVALQQGFEAGEMGYRELPMSGMGHYQICRHAAGLSAVCRTMTTIGLPSPPAS